MPLKKAEKMSTASERFNMATYEFFLDRCLRQQTEQINELLLKFSKVTKMDLNDTKKRQAFLSSKYDELITTADNLKTEAAMAN